MKKQNLDADASKLPTSSLDQSIVLSAIDAHLAEIKAAWHQKNPNNPTKEEFYFKCMDETAQSMKDQILSVSRPVDETLLESQLNAFKSRYLSIQEEDDSDSVSSDEEQDISFDDDEILDTDAYDKVRELRAKSREVASRVISVREEALERALGVTGRGVKELLQIHGFEEGEMEEEQRHVPIDDGENDRVPEPLNAALRNLTSSLKNVDSGLTEKLELLKETIGTIESTAEKYQRVSQGDENVFSQTEKAIIAASNVMTRESFKEEVVGEETMNDPDRNLARLLAGAM